MTRNGTEIQTVELASKFPKALGAFGKISKFAHRPILDPMVKPVSQKLRRLPLSLREEVSRELHHLEEQDIIETIDSSPWISNLVVARRKTGEIRLCVDLRAVSKAIIPDKYPLPSQEELMTEVSTVVEQINAHRASGYIEWEAVYILFLVLDR